MAGKESGWGWGKAPLLTMSTQPREALVPDLSPCREAANTGKKKVHFTGIPSSGGPQPLLEEENPVEGTQICKVSHPHTHMATGSSRKGKFRFHTDTLHCLYAVFPVPPLLSLPDWDDTPQPPKILTLPRQA